MELFVVGLSITGLVTLISAIDESINWMTSYRQAGEEDRQYQINRTSNYDIGYHE